jgi:hypothetical protein
MFSRTLTIAETKRMNRMKSSRELSTRSPGVYSNITAQVAKLIIYSLSELEILKRPLDFGKFPEEIRGMILEWTLVQDSSIDFGLHSPTSHQLERLAIFQTSKQIHAEAVAMFHCQNKFAMDGTNLERFLFQREPTIYGTCPYIWTVILQSPRFFELLKGVKISEAFISAWYRCHVSGAVQNAMKSA